MAIQEVPASKDYRLPEAGPIVLVTTSDEGRLGYHMVMQHAPPLIGCIIGPWDHGYRVRRGQAANA
ncbi:hypothetical protein FG93_06161 [Bosea sp. LC85]|uniref:hypothetical protein n=1 Tax=Bosea sp. LC85 TaxID=1502851 RepID=UPI0004E31950|nr:hypothetical protein [Bosea sp. LC85]KFC61570.1 hypothetical protein FG93_06161 [Bosea sp. LC85]